MPTQGAVPMFRYTIRELVLLTIIVALGVGWVLERWRNERLANALAVAENESQLMRSAVGSLHEDMERIEKTLPTHGLKLEWSRDMRPMVGKVNTTVRGNLPNP